MMSINKNIPLSHIFNPLRKALLFALSVGIFFFINIGQSLATHIRAGDITAQLIDPASRTYLISVTIYRDTNGIPFAESPAELIFYGTDNDEDNPIVVEAVSLGFTPDGNTEIGLYETEFTFPGPGFFTIGYQHFNRNGGIVNMANSIDTPFYIEMELAVVPEIISNRAPVFTVLPIDLACTGVQFQHFPGIVDADGDSIAVELISPLAGQGVNVLNPRSPETVPAWIPRQEDGTVPGIYAQNPTNGNINWNAPGEPGLFNIAFLVSEFRDGVLLSRTMRDMQVEVLDCDNDPPNLTFQQQHCIVSDSLLRVDIGASDPTDLIDYLALANQVPFPQFDRYGQEQLEYEFPDVNEILIGNPVTEIFQYASEPKDVTNAFYPFIFRTLDDPPSPTPSLSDLEELNIRVVGKPPRFDGEPTLAETEEGVSVTLNWERYTDAIPVAFYDETFDPDEDAETQNFTRLQYLVVGRRINSFQAEYDTCSTGFTGPFSDYEILDRIVYDRSNPVLEFVDVTAQRGFTYSYRIYMDFPFPSDGESLVSDEVTIFIPTSAPYVTKASVEATDETQGEVRVEWSKPVLLEGQDIGNPPFTFELQRGTGFESDSEDYVPIYTFEYLLDDGFATDFDTSFVDNIANSENTPLLNTEGLVYNYRMIFSNSTAVIDSSASASTVRADAVANLTSITINWEAVVPWNNRAQTDENEPELTHIIERKLAGEPDGNFIEVGNVPVSELVPFFTFTDDGSINGPLVEEQEYEYRVKTMGRYALNEIFADFNAIDPTFPDPIENNSQIILASLSDEVAPCPPILSIEILDCDLELERDAEQTSQTGCDGRNPLFLNNRLSWVNPDIGECNGIVDNECKTSDIAEYRIYFLDSITDNTSDLVFLRSITNPNQFFETHEREFSIEGSYAITAVDFSGNESCFSNIVSQENCPYYALPNVFTPNGNDGNDVFRPLYCPRFVERVDFVVVNRWGEEVFASNDDILLNWEGKHTNGNDLSDGVYFYRAVVQFFTSDPARHTTELKGTVHLLRGD